MAATLDAMGDASAAVQPLFITVDPERHVRVPFRIRCAIPSKFRGFDGHDRGDRFCRKSYRVFYRKAESDEASEYLMDHSGFVYLMGPDGAFLTMFRGGTNPESVAKTIAAYIQKRKSAPDVQAAKLRKCKKSAMRRQVTVDSLRNIGINIIRLRGIAKLRSVRKGNGTVARTQSIRPGESRPRKAAAHWNWARGALRGDDPQEAERFLRAALWSSKRVPTPAVRRTINSLSKKIRRATTFGARSTRAIRKSGSTRFVCKCWRICSGADLRADLVVGADPAYQLKVRVIGESPWHSLFAQYVSSAERGGKSQLRSGTDDSNTPYYKTDAERDGVNSDCAS